MGAGRHLSRRPLTRPGAGDAFHSYRGRRRVDSSCSNACRDRPCARALRRALHGVPRPPIPSYLASIGRQSRARIQLRRAVAVDPSATATSSTTTTASSSSTRPVTSCRTFGIPIYPGRGTHIASPRTAPSTSSTHLSPGLIYHLDSNGNPLQSAGTSSASSRSFRASPSNIGQHLRLRSEQRRIAEIDSRGHFVTQWGAPGQFAQPRRHRRRSRRQPHLHHRAQPHPEDRPRRQHHLDHRYSGSARLSSSASTRSPSPPTSACTPTSPARPSRPEVRLSQPLRHDQRDVGTIRLSVATSPANKVYILDHAATPSLATTPPSSSRTRSATRATRIPRSSAPLRRLHRRRLQHRGRRPVQARLLAFQGRRHAHLVHRAQPDPGRRRRSRRQLLGRRLRRVNHYDATAL